MVPFFDLAATLLTTYLTGCAWIEGDTPKYDPEVFACPTPALEPGDHLRFPGEFPSIQPPFP